MNMHGKAEEEVRVFPGAPREDYGSLPRKLWLPVEEIVRNGYTILPDQLSKEDCDRMRAATQRVYDEEVKELGGIEAMEKIGDVGVSRSPFLRDESFLVALRLPAVVSIARYFLGAAAQINLQRVVMSAPKKVHGASIWHRDFSYQDFTSSKPLALTALAMLDGSDITNGAPLTLAGSHRFERFPTDDFVRQNSIVLSCNPGDVVLMDSACYHRGGTNIGQEVRHTVVTIYTAPVVRQNVDYPRLLDGRYADDLDLRKLLGYDTKMPSSDLEYRQAKLQNSKKIATQRAM